MTDTRRTRTSEAPRPGLAGHLAPGAPTASATPGRPTSEELTAWRLFLRSHAMVLRRLENDLIQEHQLPLASYDVLVQLVEAPEHRLRMTELADAVLLSRSGLTRLVDRLEREGLVERQACVEDARGLFAVLTDGGVMRLRQASPTHLRGVQDYAVGRLTGEELRELARLLAVFTDPATPTPTPTPGPRIPGPKVSAMAVADTGTPEVLDLTEAVGRPPTRAD